MDHTEITSTAQLAEFCDRAHDSGRIAIDTEFLWERTYAPQICLVQLNIDGDVVIADPLAGIDLTPVGDLVTNPEIEVIMHAPHADLVAFALRNDVEPTRVFDTQIAAGFIGLSAGLSYERLVTETTGQKVQPSESFTDWSRRPLNDRQLRYAAEDVEYLFDVVDHIQGRLRELGRFDWAWEEMQRRFGDPRRFATVPEEAWRKVGRRNKLNGKGLAVLREVAAWRERSARSRDIPTSWVTKDPTLVEIASRKPGDAKALSKIRGVDGSMRKHDVDALLDAVEEGLRAEPIDDGPPPPRVVRKRVAIAKGLATALMRAHCEAADMAPELVGTSQDVEDLISWVASEGSIDDRPPLLRGWREQFGGELVALVEGRVQLQLSEHEPYLLIHHAADQ